MKNDGRKPPLRAFFFIFKFGFIGEFKRYLRRGGACSSRVDKSYLLCYTKFRK